MPTGRQKRLRNFVAVVLLVEIGLVAVLEPWVDGPFWLLVITLWTLGCFLIVNSARRRLYGRRPVLRTALLASVSFLLVGALGAEFGGVFWAPQSLRWYVFAVDGSLGIELPSPGSSYRCAREAGVPAGFDFPPGPHEWTVRGVRLDLSPQYWQVSLNLFYAALFPAVLFAVLFLRPLQTANGGYCEACGYDLTGNASGRCSECGCLLKPPNVPRSSEPAIRDD